MIPVAGYCRVSTDGEDQANSFLSQQRYFRDYIEKQPDWQLHEIYADEGITGTSTRKRTQFNRMINDAHAGKFRMIVTKEVSRFSRNILDTISYTRELKAMGIGVIFVNDRINTMEPEAEMLLSFLASLAQEESRRTSARVVWGQTRQMERGVVFGRSLLGYDVKDGALTINPQGAEIVRLIFHKYAVEQVSTREIARFLTESGWNTQGGNSRWRPNTIVKILKNEKYAGDLIQKKTYTPDFLTHEKRINHGQVPMVFLPNHHEPLISREIWELTQQRLQQNNKHAHNSGSYGNRYAFSGKIRCGECGSTFVGRFRYRKDGNRVRRWSCSVAAREGRAACDVGKLVRDDDAFQMLKTAIRSLPMDAETIALQTASLALAAVREAQDCSGEQNRIEAEICRIRRKREAVLDSYFSGVISLEEMQSMSRKYRTQLDALLMRKEEMESRKPENPPDWEASVAARLTAVLTGEIVSDVFCKTMVQCLTVYKDRHMELRLQHLPQVFHFKG